MPTGVPTAPVPEASDMADEHLIRAEGMSVRAPCRRVSDPLPDRGLHQFAQYV